MNRIKRDKQRCKDIRDGKISAFESRKVYLSGDAKVTRAHIPYQRGLFQMMFAAITPLLMTGAYAERPRWRVSFSPVQRSVKEGAIRRQLACLRQSKGNLESSIASASIFIKPARSQTETRSRDAFLSSRRQERFRKSCRSGNENDGESGWDEAIGG